MYVEPKEFKTWLHSCSEWLLLVHERQALIAHGADLDVSSQTGFTSLMIACQNGYLSCVQVIVWFDSALFHFDHGILAFESTIQNYLFVKAGFLGLALQVLLGHGVKIEAQNKDSYTPLLFAAQDGHFFVMKVKNHSEFTLLFQLSPNKPEILSCFWNNTRVAGFRV